MKSNLSTALFLLVLILTGCQDIDKQKKPENLIPEDKMVNVLVDMLKVSGSQSYSNIKYRRRDVNAKKLIFKKYDIDSLQLRESTSYYASDFEVNERIYDSVRSRLKFEDKKIDSLLGKQEKENFRKDHPQEKSKKLKVKK
jgi:hypothetical protein